MNEVWAVSAIAPGYMVSSLGNVRKCWDRKLKRPGRIKAKRIDENGYETVSLSPDRQKQNVFYVHRLVADGFHGSPPPGKPQARHLDGIRAHNTADNLLWGSPAENEADKVLHGTAPVGEANPFSLLTADAVREIRALYFSGGHTQKALGARFGIARSTVRNVVNRNSWSHVN